MLRLEPNYISRVACQQSDNAILQKWGLAKLADWSVGLDTLIYQGMVPCSLTVTHILGGTQHLESYYVWLNYGKLTKLSH